MQLRLYKYVTIHVIWVIIYVNIRTYVDAAMQYNIKQDYKGKKALQQSAITSHKDKAIQEPLPKNYQR